MITEIASIVDATTLYEQTNHKGFIYRGQEEYSWELDAAIQRPENQGFLKNEMKVYTDFRETIQEKLLPLKQIQPQAALGFMSAIPSPFSAEEPPPFFNFPEAHFTYFQYRPEAPKVVVPIKPLAPNEREQIQSGVFTVSNNMAVPQNGILQTCIPAPANNFVKVRIKQAAKSDILQFIKSNHGLDLNYLMSPIAELAGRIKEKYL